LAWGAYIEAYKKQHTKERPMLYTDHKSLFLAAMQAHLTDRAQFEALHHLLVVYWEAYHNPAIGVGAIAYAQDALIAAQLNSAEV